jgi:hypothetical protein
MSDTLNYLAQLLSKVHALRASASVQAFAPCLFSNPRALHPERRAKTILGKVEPYRPDLLALSKEDAQFALQTFA